MRAQRTHEGAREPSELMHQKLVRLAAARLGICMPASRSGAPPAREPKSTAGVVYVAHRWRCCELVIARKRLLLCRTCSPGQCARASAFRCRRRPPEQRRRAKAEAAASAAAAAALAVVGRCRCCCSASEHERTDGRTRTKKIIIIIFNTNSNHYY